MTIEYLKQHNCIVYECLSGSKAYGLDLPESDTDIKGVFILPKNEFYKMDYVPQVNNETNDIVYYELKRFLELCYKNNPNIIEMLYTDESDIRYEHPIFRQIKDMKFLTKQCENSFTGYARTQIKKAKGLKKKIFNPIPKEKKSIIDFCYILKENHSIPLNDWLNDNNLLQKNCGLTNIQHMNNLYGLYYDDIGTLGFYGIMKKEHSDNIALSRIPKDLNLKAYLSFNPDEYSKYCKEYKEYWNWVDHRNEERYKSTISHKKNYDSKNLMHTFRLINMALEIAEDEQVYVKRKDRDFLLKIRRGEFEYEELVSMAEEKLFLLGTAYSKSNLPNTTNLQSVNTLLVRIRTEFYEL